MKNIVERKCSYKKNAKDIKLQCTLKNQLHNIYHDGLKNLFDF